MRHFCSIADIKFIRQVLALNKSLYSFNNNYTLHLLCLDNSIHKTISHPNIITYHINDFLNIDKNLQNAKQNPPSREAIINANNNYFLAQEIQFTYLLASYFTDYCINYLDSDILYVDSDIYFFDDWSKLQKITSTISVGLVENRLPFDHNNGKYNVGIVYFKNDIIGKQCADFWKNCLLFPTNKYAKEYGTCGDQKYLELFPLLFKNVESIDNYFGHLAPWNINYHNYIDNKIIWKQNIQDLMYYHFSNFKFDFDTNRYFAAPRHNLIDLSNNPFIKKLYDIYYSEIKSVL